MLVNHLFYSLLHQGNFDLRVWADVEADGIYETTTPGKGKDSSKNQMQRLAKLAKKHRNGQIPKVDWLDRLTFREIEMINEREKNESENMYLLIEFPTVLCEQTNQTVIFLHPVVESLFLAQHLKYISFVLASIRLSILNRMVNCTINSIQSPNW